MKLHDRFPKVRLPLWATLLAAVLLAGAITLLALWCQPNALRSVLAVFRSQPLLIVLNCLPVGMLLLVFTCLFRNVFFGAALVNFAVCALSIANRIKIEVRDEPVFPRDFALLNQLRTTVRETEVAAAEAFHNGAKYTRGDIIEELNRMSSALHIMMCRYLAGQYQD